MKTKTVKSLLKGISLSFSIVLLLFFSACANKDHKNKTHEPTEKSVALHQNKNVEKPKEDIHMAIISGHHDIVEQHIKAGTDINQKEQMSGSTPLMTAITFNKPEISNTLIKAGSDLTIKNNEGSTALHNAAFFCRIEIVQMLIDAGADKSLKNNYGVTPREIVMGTFKDMKPVYEMVIQQLKPMGFKLELEEVEKARPVVAMMLE